MKKLTTHELKRLWLEFWTSKGYKTIPSASVVPENDATVLFTTAGMHPLVPYLLGEKHPMGDKLCDYQACIRTNDIDDVGDPPHCTFFEMLGNWTLGECNKREMIKNSFYCICYYDENYAPPRRKNSRRDLFDYQPKSGTKVAYDFAVKKCGQVINVFEA